MRGGLALPNPWLYYLAAQLQHIARAMPTDPIAVGGGVNSTTALMCHVTGVSDMAMGLEALAYANSNKRFPTYVLMQKEWNKTRQLLLQSVTRWKKIWGYLSEAYIP